MKKISFYTEKITHYLMLWKNYLPITNMVLFGIVILLIGFVAGLIILPVTDVKPPVDQDTLRNNDNIELVSTKFVAPKISEFESIKKKNLFRPSRTEWASKKAPPLPVKKKPKRKVEKKKKPVVKKKARPRIKAKKIKLSAIMVFGDTKVALIENIDKKKSKEKFVYVKEGEDIGGYTVKSIEREKLVVEWNGKESEINVYDFKSK